VTEIETTGLEEAVDSLDIEPEPELTDEVTEDAEEDEDA